MLLGYGITLLILCLWCYFFFLFSLENELEPKTNFLFTPDSDTAALQKGLPSLSYTEHVTTRSKMTEVQVIFTGHNNAKLQYL
jgi:hypothetical protein